MADSEGNQTASRGPAERPAWEESLSREIELLVQDSDSFEAEWKKRYAEDLFQSPLVLQAYLPIVKGHPVLRAFKIIHSRTEAGAKSDPAAYEKEFEASALAIAHGEPPARLVPCGLFYYLHEAVAQARAQKREHLVADGEPIARILEFGRELIDHPALSAFRVDILNQFPTKAEATSKGTDRTDSRITGGEAVPDFGGHELPQGHRFGQYSIVRLLGEGGFAQVYLAQHEGLSEPRALKVFVYLSSVGAERRRTLKRFYEEARTQAKLRHPNIVQVYDVAEFEGYLVLVMEYVEGRNLRTLIEERKAERRHLAPREIIEIGIAVATALAYAHGQSFVHRDIKPENILLGTDGGIKVGDFGLAKTLDEAGQRRTTRMGYLMGTPHYMAPEQIGEERYDARCDVYALGGVLYHMAYGEPPFDAADAFSILEKHRSEKPVSLLTHLEGFPEELNGIILTCLEKDPSDRYSSAGDLAQALKECRDKLPGDVIVTERPRRKRAFAVAAFVLVLIAAIPIYFSFRPKGVLPETGTNPVAERKEMAALDRRPTEDGKPAAESGDKTVETTSRPEGKTISPDTDVRVPSPGLKVGATAEHLVKEPPAPRLRERLAARPAGERARALVGELLSLFEKRRMELRRASYQILLDEIDAFEKKHLGVGAAQDVASDDGYARAHLIAARSMLELSHKAVRSKLDKLRSSAESVTLKTVAGPTVSGRVVAVDDTRISLQDDQGTTIAVELSGLALEQFVPEAGAAVAELAFRGITLRPSKVLGQVLDMEAGDENLVLWTPFLVRLARIEVEREAQQAALEAKEPLDKERSIEASTGALIHHVAFAQAEGALAKELVRIGPLYNYLEGDFSKARRERESLELLLARRYSQVLASYGDTGAGPVASELLIRAFERKVEAGSEELMAGSGWYNNDWKVWPAEPDLKKRQKLFQTGDPRGIVLRDPDGSRSLIMNDNTTRATEGVLLRLSFEPEPVKAEDAYWSFLLLAGKGKSDTVSLRVDAVGVALYRSVFQAGAKDVCIARASVPPRIGEDLFRTFAFVPGNGYLHIFVDRKHLLTLPEDKARIPNQLEFTVCHGQGVVRSILAQKVAPAASAELKQKKESDK